MSSEIEPADDAAAVRADDARPVGDGAAAPDQPGPATILPPRPMVERLGMAAIATFAAVTFVAMAAFSFGGGDPVLGVLAIAGALMATWAGVRTLVRG